MLEKQFTEVIQFIKQARFNAIKSVNTELIDLYWKIGEYISKKIEIAEWGQSVVDQLAEYLNRNEPDLKGFSNKNLWRMRQFYEAYKDSTKLSPLVREISWTNNLIIFSRTKTEEEREFYLKLSLQEKYGKRELERQISSSFYERVMIGKASLSPVVKIYRAALFLSL